MMGAAEIWFDFIDCYPSIQEAERVCYQRDDCYILNWSKLDQVVQEYGAWSMNGLKRLAKGHWIRISARDTHKSIIEKC